MKVLVLALAFGGLLYAAFNAFEWDESKRWVPAQPEVRSRPLLVAGLFLQQQGFEVSRIVDRKRYDELPDTVGTLFVCEGRGEMGESQLNELQAWVLRGGHLVINSAGTGGLMSDDTEQQASADQSQVAVAKLHLERGISAANEAVSENCWQQDYSLEPEGNSAEAAIKLFDYFADEGEHYLPAYLSESLSGAGRDTTVAFSGANWLLQDDKGSADMHWPSNKGTQLISQPYGDGRLTVLAGFQPFFNAHIEQHDNAYALQAVVASGGRRDAEIWFQERSLDYPSLIGVFWHRAPQLFALSLLLFAALGWALFARRSEPREHRVQPVSQLRQQFHAFAFYQWRVSDTQRLTRHLHDTIFTPDGPAGSVAENNHSKPRTKTGLIALSRAHWRQLHKNKAEKST